MRIRARNRKIAAVITGMLVAAIAVEIIVIVKNGRIGSHLGAEGKNRLAENVIATCKNESYRPACYDREIPKLMDSISMEDTFAVTRIVQDQDNSYSFCHVLGHELSAREVKKNPDQWKEVIARCPSGVCSNGCIHGGLQERFRAESLTDAQARAIVPDLQTLCEPKPTWDPTGLERGSCYHALGHLAMYMAAGDIQKSVDLCGNITSEGPGRDFHHICLDGAFMQIFQPLEPEDFALVKGKQPTKDTVKQFCDPFTGEARGSCISEGWPLFAKEIKSPSGLIAFCSREDPAERSRCFDGLFYILTVQFQFDTNKMAGFCAGFADPERGRCFAGVVSRLIETDYRNVPASIRFCSEVASVDSTGACFKGLVSDASFHFHAGSKEFFNLCTRLPDGWKEICLNSK